MTSYQVVVKETRSYTVHVEAESENQAYDLAVEAIEADEQYKSTEAVKFDLFAGDFDYEILDLI